MQMGDLTYHGVGKPFTFYGKDGKRRISEAIGFAGAGPAAGSRQCHHGTAADLGQLREAMGTRNSSRASYWGAPIGEASVGGLTGTRLETAHLTGQRRM
jgi:hypothetical protein